MTKPSRERNVASLYDKYSYELDIGTLITFIAVAVEVGDIDRDRLVLLNAGLSEHSQVLLNNMIQKVVDKIDNQ